MKCNHYNFKPDSEHRHYINSADHNNCVLCLVDDKGPMTQEQVAGYLGIAKECVHVVEKRALKKLTRLMKRNNFLDVPTLTVQKDY